MAYEDDLALLKGAQSVQTSPAPAPPPIQEPDSDANFLKRIQQGRVSGGDIATGIGSSGMEMPVAPPNPSWQAPEGRPTFRDLMAQSGEGVNPEKAWSRALPEMGMGLGAGKILSVAAKYMPKFQKLLQYGSESLINPKNARQAALGGAAEGGMAGVVDPSLDPGSAAVGGAVGGGVMQKVPQVAMRGVDVDPKAQNLLDRDVKVTTGGRLGPGWRATEDKMQSIPFAGDSIRGAKTRELDSFHRERINNALSDVGRKLPKAVPAGYDSTRYANRRVSQKYNSLLKDMTVKRDPVFDSEVANILDMSKSLDASGRNAVEQAVTRDIDRPFNNPNGLLLGKTLKETSSKLRTEAELFTKSTDPYQIKTGTALEELNQSFSRLIHRNNPDKSPALKGADRAYAKMRTLDKASSSTGAVEGVPNATQTLLAAKRAVDEKTFAQGTGFDQRYLADAKQVMSQKVNNSGTTDRAILAGMVGVGAARPHLTPGMLGSVAGGYAAYTPMGQEVVNAALFNRGKSMPEAYNKFGPRVSQLGGLLGIEATREEEEERKRRGL